jgi:hypothetical protein
VRRSLDRVLELLLSLRERAQYELTDRAVKFDVAVDPGRARVPLDNLKFRGPLREHHLNQLAQTMLDHGHVLQAVDFMSERRGGGPHPFHMAGSVMARVDLTCSPSDPARFDSGVESFAFGGILLVFAVPLVHPAGR